jgi:hypothetical protein
VGKRRQRSPAGIYQHHRPRALARRDRRLGSDICVWAIKTNIGDLLEVVVHVERRPGVRFISEVLELNGYDPDTDLFDFSVVYAKEGCP